MPGEQLEIVGYETTDGAYHSFHGTARFEHHEWVFVPSKTWAEEKAPRHVRPAADVQWLDVAKSKDSAPVVAAGTLVVVLGVLAAVWFAGLGSWNLN